MPAASRCFIDRDRSAHNRYWRSNRRPMDLAMQQGAKHDPSQSQFDPVLSTNYRSAVPGQRGRLERAGRHGRRRRAPVGSAGRPCRRTSARAKGDQRLAGDDFTDDLAQALAVMLAAQRGLTLRRSARGEHGRRAPFRRHKQTDRAMIVPTRRAHARWARSSLPGRSSDRENHLLDDHSLLRVLLLKYARSGWKTSKSVATIGWVDAQSGRGGTVPLQGAGHLFDRGIRLWKPGG